MSDSRKTNYLRRFLLLCLIALLCSATGNFLYADGLRILKDAYRHRDSTIELGEFILTDMTEENGVYYSDSVDPQIRVSNPDGYLSTLCLKFTVVGNIPSTLKVYYTTDGVAFDEDRICEAEVSPGENVVYLPIHDNATLLRIDPFKLPLLGITDLRAYDVNDFQVPGFSGIFTARTALIFLLLLFLGAHLVFPIGLLYDFIYRNRFALGFSLVLFGVIFNINGSSLSMWFKDIPAEGTSIAFGSARQIRSDEYAVFTPMIFSQAYGAEPYSWFSQVLRGSSTDTFMIYALPVKTWALIFRPFLAGFIFLGNARGLAFFWWARAVCLWLVSFQLLLLITGRRKRLSAAGACMILFSPIVQWWFAINALAEMLIFGSLFILLLDLYLRDSRHKVRILCLLGMVICGGGYILTLYPAWMVPLAYVYLALTIWVIAKNRKTCSFHRRDALEFVGAVALLGLCMVYVLSHSLDTVRTIMNTAYPGNHTYTGGELGGIEIFYYPASLFYSQQTEDVFLNVCETATFFDFFPLGIVLSAYILLRKKGRDLLTWLLLACSLLLGLWCTIGFPAWLAKITLLSISTGPRAYLAFSLVNLLLLFRAASVLPSLPSYAPGSLRKPLYLVFAVMFSILYTSEIIQGTRLYFGEYIDASPERNTVMVLVLLTGALLIFFIRRTETLACLFLSAVMIIANIGVNPMQVGTGELYESPLAQTIQEIVEKDPDALWVTANGSSLPDINYPILFGARSINSTSTYPDLEKWSSIDPDGEYEEVYNRYAHAYIRLMKDSSPTEKFRLQSNDTFLLYLSPEDIKTLGIKYVLTKWDIRYLSDEIVYEEICCLNGHYIYEAVY